MKKPSENTGTIARSAGVVGAAVMCSRVLGLVREQVFAILFGAGYFYDAFVVAFRIPNLLRDLFGEGALSAAFVTVFSDYQTNRNERDTWRLVNNLMVFLTIFLSLICLAGILLAEPIVRLLVEQEFEMAPGKVALTTTLTSIMFPFLLLVSLSSVVMGILNTKGRFFIPALASSFFNLGSILAGGGLALLLPRFGYPAIVGMAIGTLTGGLLQLACQLPTLLKCGFPFKPLLDLKDPGLHRILKLMLPAIAGLSALQLNVFVNNFFASSLQEGSLSWLNYAFRFFQFPVGVFGVAVSVATLPLIATSAAKKDFEAMKSTYVSALTMGFCLTLPATAGLILLADPIVRVVFEHGRFDAYSTMKTAEALRFYALGLFAYASVKIMVPVFYTLNTTRYPVIGSFLAVGINIVVILLTIDTLGHKAPALSISIAMLINFLFLSTVLYWKLAGYSLTYLGSGLLKVSGAVALMCLWLRLVQGSLSPWMSKGLVQEISGLLILILSSALLYGATLYFLRFRELKLLTEKVMVKIGGGDQAAPE